MGMHLKGIMGPQAQPPPLHATVTTSYNIGVNQSSVKTSKTKSQTNAISYEADYIKYLLYGWDVD